MMYEFLGKGPIRLIGLTIYDELKVCDSCGDETYNLYSVGDEEYCKKCYDSHFEIN